MKRGAGNPDGSAENSVKVRDDKVFLDLTVRYLARSDKSKIEVARYLARQGASRDVANATLQRLEHLGYLNEAAHALRWTERRLAQRPSGRLRMRQELLLRGFSDKLTEETIQKIYATVDEPELALQALALRGGRQTVLQKGRFLQARGFSRDTIARVLHIETEE
ncbi:MAG TPA: regulatory protein RecX [Nitrospiraceae bacterium]|nr:regulatory protein RecX [Nitrospiraceae bacterium]